MVWQSCLSNVRFQALSKTFRTFNWFIVAGRNINQMNIRSALIPFLNFGMNRDISFNLLFITLSNNAILCFRTFKPMRYQLPVMGKNRFL